MNSSEVSSENCVTAIAFSWYPFTSNDARGSEEKSFYGIHVNVMEETAKKYNFCLQILPSPINVFGQKTENGSFTGAIGLIAREEYDAFVTGGTISFNRAKVVDFSESTVSDYHSVIYKYPKIQPDMSGFIKPYSFNSWMVILFGILALLAVMVLDPMMRKMYDEGSVHNKGIIFRAFRFTYGVILCQDLPTVKNLRIGKLMLFMWLPLALVLQLTYKCNLKAMLTIQTLDIPFSTVGDLLTHSGKPTLLIGEATTIDDTLKGADEKTLYGRLNKVLGRFSFQQAIRYFEGIDTNEYALVMTGLKGTIHMEYNRKGYCSKAVMRTSFYQVDIAMIFPKHSPIKKKVDRVIIGFREFGIIDFMMDRFTSIASKCVVRPNEISKEMRPLVLQDVHGIFALLAGGLTISFLVFLGELLTYRLFRG